MFQQGHLEGLLGFDSVGAVESTIPLLVLAFGFGLSMDYEVFLLSRIVELHERGYSNDDAVVVGLQRSGRIITSAALLVVIVFSGFVAGQLLIIKQTGVGLADRRRARRHPGPDAARAGDDDPARRLELVGARSGCKGCTHGSGSPSEPERLRQVTETHDCSVLESHAVAARSSATTSRRRSPRRPGGRSARRSPSPAAPTRAAGLLVMGPPADVDVLVGVAGRAEAATPTALDAR